MSPDQGFDHQIFKPPQLDKNQRELAKKAINEQLKLLQKDQPLELANRARENTEQITDQVNELRRVRSPQDGETLASLTLTEQLADVATTAGKLAEVPTEKMVADRQRFDELNQDIKDIFVYGEGKIGDQLDSEPESYQDVGKVPATTTEESVDIPTSDPFRDGIKNILDKLDARSSDRPFFEQIEKLLEQKKITNRELTLLWISQLSELQLEDAELVVPNKIKSELIPNIQSDSSDYSLAGFSVYEFQDYLKQKNITIPDLKSLLPNSAKALNALFEKHSFENGFLEKVKPPEYYSAIKQPNLEDLVDPQIASGIESLQRNANLSIPAEIKDPQGKNLKIEPIKVLFKDAAGAESRAIILVKDEQGKLWVLKYPRLDRNLPTNTPHAAEFIIKASQAIAGEENVANTMVVEANRPQSGTDTVMVQEYTLPLKGIINSGADVSRIINQPDFSLDKINALGTEQSAAFVRFVKENQDILKQLRTIAFRAIASGNLLDFQPSGLTELFDSNNFGVDPTIRKVKLFDLGFNNLSTYVNSLEDLEPQLQRRKQFLENQKQKPQFDETAVRASFLTDLPKLDTTYQDLARQISNLDKLIGDIPPLLEKKSSTIEVPASPPQPVLKEATSEDPLKRTRDTIRPLLLNLKVELEKNDGLTPSDFLGNGEAAKKWIQAINDWTQAEGSPITSLTVLPQERQYTAKIEVTLQNGHKMSFIFEP